MFNYKKIKFFKTTDYFFGLINSGLINKDELFNYLDNLKNDSSIELCIHPSKLRKKNNKSRFNDFYNSINRIKEKNLLFSKDLSLGFKSRKIKLIKYQDLT